LQANDRSIYGKLGEAGIVAVRTKQAILIAHYSPPVFAGEATKVVEDLADYLIGVNY
jgi:profilin